MFLEASSSNVCATASSTGKLSHSTRRLCRLSVTAAFKSLHARHGLGRTPPPPLPRAPGVPRWLGMEGGARGGKAAALTAPADASWGGRRPPGPDAGGIAWEQELLETFHTKAPISRSLGLRSRPVELPILPARQQRVS